MKRTEVNVSPSDVRSFKLEKDLGTDFWLHSFSLPQSWSAAPLTYAVNWLVVRAESVLMMFPETVFVVIMNSYCVRDNKPQQHIPPNYGSWKVKKVSDHESHFIVLLRFTVTEQACTGSFPWKVVVNSLCTFFGKNIGLLVTNNATSFKCLSHERCSQFRF